MSQRFQCNLIHGKIQVTNGKKIAYAQFCCNIRLQREEINRTRLTVYGNKL